MARPWVQRIGVTLCAWAALAGTAAADRRTALAGNELFEDPDDVYRFPQLVLDYRNRVMFDYGADEATGDGALLFGGDDMAFALAFHRGDLWSSDVVHRGTELGAMLGVGDLMPGIGGGGPFAAPATILDAAMGMDLGDAAFGLHLGIGHGGTSTPSATDPDESDTVGESLILLGGGYSMDGDLDLDLGLNLALGFASATAAGDDVLSGGMLRIGAGGRGYSAMSDDVDLGFLANIAFDRRSTTVETVDPATSRVVRDLNFRVGAGPRFRPSERATIGAYATLGVSLGFDDPDDQVADDATNTTTLLLPGARVAFEVQPTDWFFFRSGIEYNYFMQSASTGDAPSASVRDGSFVWNAGMGLKFDEFRIDGAFSHEFLTQGPDFIGGDAGSLFAMVSASYAWGQPGAPVAAAPEPAPPPPPAPAPVVEPEPAPVTDSTALGVPGALPTTP